MDEKQGRNQVLMEELKAISLKHRTPPWFQLLTKDPSGNYNRVIEELNTLTGRDYSKLRLSPTGTFKVEFVGL